MNEPFPIVPPPELVEKWRMDYMGRGHAFIDVATKAAQWGSDQELEACCQNMKSIPSPLGVPFGEMASNALRASRRPKPPSLKEQALAALEVIPKLVGFESERDAIRLALEALSND
jgi:hypothetical protein